MRRPFAAVLALTIVGAGVYLAVHAPFAFYSPDMGLHTAKILRAERGEWFRDPVSGTLTIYPSLFHVVFGTLKRLLGLGSFEIVRAALLAQFLGLIGAYFFLARSVLGDGDSAALCTLSLPLLFYAPSGRHILVESPANFALPFLFLGYGLVHRHLRRPAAATPFWACLSMSFAVNVVWYEAVPVLAFVAVASVVGWRHPETLRRPHLLAAVLGLLLPCVFTAVHMFSIRSVLPAYAVWAEGELRASGFARPFGTMLSEWLVGLVTKGNGRFSAVLERSALARLHYYGLALPFTLGLVGFLLVRLRGLRQVSDRRERDLVLAPGLAAALIFLLSMGLNAYKDPPRVQFVGWGLLLAFAFSVARASRQFAPAVASTRGALVARRLGAGALAVAGLLALGYTVAHTRDRFASLPSPTTQAVVNWIRTLPGHTETRIFATRASLRRLTVFVPFLGFVNHSDGWYQGQDAETTRRLRDAYETLEQHQEGWREVLKRFDVRYLALRHVDPDEREIGLFYLRHGRAVLQNAEWWVVEVAATPTAPP